ncbi:MAG: HD domain-containing protein [Phycisphaerales bacterium JB059]
MDERERIVDFLHEAGMLARSARTGFAQLGEYTQSVAEHVHRTAVIGMSLAWTAGKDAVRVAQLCLVHDLPEARTLDLHHLAKRYVRVDEEAAVADMTRGLAFGGRVRELIAEYVACESEESVLAHDADQLELLLCLRELVEMGNTRAGSWVARAEARLRTETARAWAETVREAPGDRWWKAPGDGLD